MNNQVNAETEQAPQGQKIKGDWIGLTEDQLNKAVEEEMLHSSPAKVWTEKHELILRKTWGKVRTSKIAEHLGVSVSTVEKKAKNLKLSKTAA